VQAGKTVPQGLLCLVAILMFTVLALNIVLLTLAPQYTTYGNQRYPVVPEVLLTLCSVAFCLCISPCLCHTHSRRARRLARGPALPPSSVTAPPHSRSSSPSTRVEST
jgi:hypothetical protein